MDVAYVYIAGANIALAYRALNSRWMVRYSVQLVWVHKMVGRFEKHHF